MRPSRSALSHQLEGFSYCTGGVAVVVIPSQSEVQTDSVRPSLMLLEVPAVTTAHLAVPVVVSAQIVGVVPLFGPT